MRLKLYRSSTADPLDAPANAEWGEVEALLTGLNARGVRVEILDTANMHDDVRRDIYTTATAATRPRHVSLSKVFGHNQVSRDRSAGRTIPLLLVYDDDGARPTNAYPHRAGEAIVTIRDYLMRLHLAQGDRPGRHV